jgi:hypothetical protein
MRDEPTQFRHAEKHSEESAGCQSEAGDSLPPGRILTVPPICYNERIC